MRIRMGTVASGILLAASVSSPAVWAATSSTLSDETASLRFTIGQSLSEVHKRLDRELISQLQGLPFVKTVRLFYREPAKQKSRFTKSEKWYLFVTPDNRQIIQDSVFVITKESTDCGSPTECVPMVDYDLAGPIATDERWQSDLNHQWLSKSLTFSVTATAGSSGTDVSYSFSIADSSYQRYLHRLVKKHVLSEMPTQEQMLKGVLLQFFRFKKSLGEGK